MYFVMKLNIFAQMWLEKCWIQCQKLLLNHSLSLCLSLSLFLPFLLSILPFCLRLFPSLQTFFQVTMRKKATETSAYLWFDHTHLITHIRTYLCCNFCVSSLMHQTSLQIVLHVGDVNSTQTPMSRSLGYLA